MPAVPYSLCRAHPILSGAPTTIHSPVRQAIALLARLGCQLLQIILTLASVVRQGRWVSGDIPFSCDGCGVHPYTLPKARTVWLAHTVNACLSYRVSSLPAVFVTPQPSVEYGAYQPLEALGWHMQAQNR
jgi:hypothetical protein